MKEVINKLAEITATLKLECIIESEGDANGKRRQPEYLQMLIKEEKDKLYREWGGYNGEITKTIL